MGTLELRARVTPPQRELGVHAGPGHLAFPVRPDVGQEEVAKRHRVNAVGLELLVRLAMPAS